MNQKTSLRPLKNIKNDLVIIQNQFMQTKFIDLVPTLFIASLKESDLVDRIPVEGKFGQLKRRFGLNRIMTKLSETTQTVIFMTVLIVNLERVRQKIIFIYFFAKTWLFGASLELVYQI